MNRSNYSDDCDDLLALGRWRGRVASALRGARGQALLRRLAAALDAMPVKKLACITSGDGLSQDGCDCALGVLARLEGVPLDDSEPETLGRLFNVWYGLAAEVMWINDEQYSHDYYYGPKRYEGEQLRWASPSDEGRWVHVRDWVARHLKEKTNG